MTNIDPQQLILMMGLHEAASGLVKSLVASLKGDGEAFPTHLLVYAALGYGVYWAIQQGWHDRAAKWWEWRGMASVQLSAEVEHDYTVEKNRVPDRFLAVLAKIHHYLTEQKIHAQCISFQVLTPLRGATDVDETALTYLMPFGDRKLKLIDRETKTTLWLKTSVAAVEQDSGNGGGGGGGGGRGGGGGGRGRLQAPKQSVSIEVFCKDSSASLDATLRAWEKEYDRHIALMMRKKLTVLRPEVRTYYDDSPYLVYHEHPLGEVTLDDLVLGAETRRQLDGILGSLADPDRFKRIGADYQVNILLHGPPGTGKTTLAKAMARELNRFLMHVRLQSMKTVQLMEEVFTRPGGTSANITAKDVIYLLDEFDHALKELLDDKSGGLFAGLGAIGNGAVSTPVKVGSSDPPSVHSIKAVLDGALNVPGRVVIATSNSIERLHQMGEDSSFLRARRMECIYVGLTDSAMVREFWRRVFGEGHPLEDAAAAAVPEHLLAPAEVSSVLLACHGRPAVALKDLGKMVAAKQEAARGAGEGAGAESGGQGEGEKPGGREGKEEGEAGEGDGDKEGGDGEGDGDSDAGAEKGAAPAVTVHVHLNGVRLGAEQLGAGSPRAIQAEVGAGGVEGEAALGALTTVHLRHVGSQAALGSDKGSTVGDDGCDSLPDAASQ